MKMKRKRQGIFALLVALIMLGLSFAIPTVLEAKTYELRYATELGLSDLINEIDKLDSTKRILYVGAHPDDEWNSTLVYLARKEGADVVLQTLNWGEGGENAIGSEFGPALGALRAEESRSTRIFDQAHQAYGNTYDFGYSVSLNESLLGDRETGTEGLWHRDMLVYEIARVIREVRPQLILTSHRAPGYDHGQHTAAGFATVVAMSVAADEDYVITGSDGEALAAHQAAKLFTPPYAAWQLDRLTEDAGYIGSESSQDPGKADVVLELGEYDVRLGMSYGEWGAVARNMHKSQKMIREPGKGSEQQGFMLKTIAPELNLETEGVATTLFGGLNDALTVGELSFENAASAAELVAKIRENFDVRKPHLSANDLAELYGLLDVDGEDVLVEVALEQVRDRVRRVLGMSLGLDLELRPSDYDVNPGQTFELDARIQLRNDPEGLVDPETLIDGLELHLRDGWSADLVVSDEEADQATAMNPSPLQVADRQTGILAKYSVSASAEDMDYTGPFNAPYNEAYVNPYYPYGSIEGGVVPIESESQEPNEVLDEILAVLATEDQMNFGLTTDPMHPFAPAPLSATFTLQLGEVSVPYEVEPVLRLVPEVSVLVQNASLMLQAAEDDLQSELHVLVRNESSEPLGTLSVQATPDTEIEGLEFTSTEVTLESEGQTQLVTLEGTIPASFVDQSLRVQVSVTTEDGKVFEEGFLPIEYEHVDRINFYEEAVQNLTVQDYSIASDDLRIGFIPGGSDDFVVDYIRGMYRDPANAQKNVTIMTENDIAASGARLAENYDTIIVGKTALADQSPIHAALRSSMRNLLDFANNGGNLVLHYQNWRNAEGVMPLAPIPFELGTTNINHEESDVFIDADALDNPLYAGINEIDLEMNEEGISESTIFDGWIQQRTEWTPGSNEDGQVEAMEELGYTVLFRAQDPESTMRPAILYYPMENGGSFTYSAVVWDKQLDMLVPGAYVLYANLISMSYDSGE